MVSLVHKHMYLGEVLILMVFPLHDSAHAQTRTCTQRCSPHYPGDSLNPPEEEVLHKETDKVVTTNNCKYLSRPIYKTLPIRFQTSVTNGRWNLGIPNKLSWFFFFLRSLDLLLMQKRKRFGIHQRKDHQS